MLSFECIKNEIWADGNIDIENANKIKQILAEKGRYFLSAQYGITAFEIWKILRKKSLLLGIRK